MKKIAFTGGKGGTGKSTIAILNAIELLKEKKRIILCDCDVECPNDYLLLDQKLKKAEQNIYAEYPKLDKNKCTLCGKCQKACRSNAIFQAPGQFPVFIKELCSSCGVCWNVCPQKAIQPEKEKIGEIFVNKVKKNFWLITGVVRPGVEETGPAVAKTKKFALSFAKKQKADFVLFDTAAGTHCPVIAALIGSDLAMAVTEPTPMGAHDLKLVLELCQKLKIPFKVILNQADLGDKSKILEIVKEFKTKIEKEVPYSKKIVELYSKGNLLDY